MSDNKVSATAKMKDEAGNVVKEITGEVEYNFGSNTKEATEMFGEDVVFSQFKQAAVISLQSVMRRLIAAGKSPEEVQAGVNEWKPGIKTTVRKSPKEKIMESFSGMSEEDRKALLKELKHAA